MISKDQLLNIWNDYAVIPLSNNLHYVSFAAPFLFSRVFVSFKANEPIAYRITEGVAFAAIAYQVNKNVEKGELKDYSASYLPVLGSLIYHQNIFPDNNIANLVTASAITTAAIFSIDYGIVADLIPAVITYGIGALNLVPAPYSYALPIIAGGLDYLLFKDDNHYASWSVAGGVMAQSILAKYNPSANLVIKSFAVLGGAAVSLIPAMNEDKVIDQLFAIEHFKKTYNIMTKFVDPEILNLQLERHFVTTINLQMGLGFLGNYLLLKVQEKNNMLAKVEPQGDGYSNFNYKALEFAVKTVPFYWVVRVIVDQINYYNKNQFINLFQEKLVDNLGKRQNFIQTSKTNHTILSYLEDVKTIFDDHNIVSVAMFGVPKLVNIHKLDLMAYTSLPIIMIGDLLVNLVFQYLIQKQQEFSKNKKQCESQLAKVTEHDKEYAGTILQKDALEIVVSEWRDIQQCILFNNFAKNSIKSAFDSSQWVYRENILFTGLHMIIANMLSKGIINPVETFLYTRTLETITTTLLFKSKNQADFAEIETAALRIDELVKQLDSTSNNMMQITYQVDAASSGVVIDDLDFTRGNKEQKSEVMIDHLELIMGKFYAVTGANGSGKSSFTTLLQYVLGQIEDSSFTASRGNITYHSDVIHAIPQKDYIAFNSSLAALIMHPNEINQAYEDKMVEFVNMLGVFQHNITSKALYEKQENWKDLSGGQKKKLFLIKELITCPEVLIMDELFGPLDVEARPEVMDIIKHSCLKDSLLLVVWHQDKNLDGTSCVREKFFDYELHLENAHVLVGQVSDC